MSRLKVDRHTIHLCLKPPEPGSGILRKAWHRNIDKRSHRGPGPEHNKGTSREEGFVCFFPLPDHILSHILIHLVRPHVIRIHILRSSFKSLVKRAIVANRVASFNRENNNKALNGLRNFEKQNGALSKAITAQCDEYAIECLGGKQYAPWLYLYSAIQGKFKEGWLPENFYIEKIAPKINGAFSAPSRLISLSNRLLNTDLLPDLLYSYNNTFFRPSDYKIVSAAEAVDLLFDKRDSVIFKSNSSYGGQGVRFYSKNEWIVESKKPSLANGAFQKIIDQHEFFNRIYPYPGATIRISTLLNPDGKAASRVAYIRFGSNNNNCSSRHVQGTNSISIAIHLDTGMLFPVGYTHDWRRVDAHPDTDTPFKGLVIPNFVEACRKVEELHNRYPFVRFIGWDVSINIDEQLEIMEWNAVSPSVRLNEAVHGPNFTDLFQCVNKRVS